MEEIIPELILNWDQTAIKIVPSSQWTMEKRARNRVEMIGVDDKRQITAVFCDTLVGDFLPIQVIYTGKTNRCHSKYQFPLDWNEKGVTKKRRLGVKERSARKSYKNRTM